MYEKCWLETPVEITGIILYNNTMRFFLVILVLFQMLTLLGCKLDNIGDSPLTDQQQVLVQQLNERLIPLNGPVLELSDSEISFLDQIKDARILGLGEATHGTKEFFEMKHRIFQYMVEQHQHKAIAFEADFAESIYINNYVSGSVENLETLMNSVMQFWCWNTGEVADLLRWMRFYNSDKPLSQHLFYFGIDCQSTAFQPGLLQEYLSRTMPRFWQTAEPLITEIAGMEAENYQRLPPADFQQLNHRLDALSDLMEANKDPLTAASSLNEYKLYKQVLRTFMQAFRLLYYFETGYGTYERDRFMAENALWIIDFLGPNAKISLWAHNGHIAMDETYLGSGSVGYLLSRSPAQTTRSYQCVGFGFSQGGFSAQSEDQSGKLGDVNQHEISSEPRQNSINYLWHYAEQSNFVFQPEAFDDTTQWADWLNSRQPCLMIGSTYNGEPTNYYRPTFLKKSFDIIIYFDSTRATHPN